MHDSVLTARYKKGSLWLTVLGEVLLIPILAILPFMADENVTFIGGTSYALLVSLIMGNLIVVLQEIYRNGVAVCVGSEGNPH